MDKEPAIQEIRSKIVSLPGRPPAMTDRDLAEIYGTKTKRVNEAAKRNPDRFPQDFRFQMTKGETEILRSQNATFQWLQEVKYLPWAYTREGCNMMSACLETPTAIGRSVFIMRAFSATEAEAARRHADSEAGSQISGDQFDLSVKRFKVALEAVRLMGITDRSRTRRIANEITKDTAGVDLMAFILPYCSPVSGQRIAEEENGAMNSFVVAWWDRYAGNPVASRQLYQVIADNRIPLDLGAGSRRSQKIRLSRMLSEMNGQQVGAYSVIGAGKCKGVLVWRLEKVGK